MRREANNDGLHQYLGRLAPCAGSGWVILPSVAYDWEMQSRSSDRHVEVQEPVRERGARRVSHAAASVSHEVCGGASVGAVPSNTRSMLGSILSANPREGADPESMQRAPLLSGLEALRMLRDTR